MTLSSTPAKEIKLGNDVATSFSFTFVINSSDDLVVTFTDTDGNETVLTEGTGTSNYSVSVSSYPGVGSITYPATLGTELATGEKLTIARVVDLDQETDLQNQAQYKPEQVEAAFDYGRMIDLQQQEQIDRSIKAPISDNSGADYTLPTPQANRVIGVWNADGDGIDIGPTASEISSAQGFATAASNSATAAASSATDAQTAQTAAEAAQAAAEIAVNGALWSGGVTVLTNADSPYTVVVGDAGKYFVIDTSGGNVVVNLPSIATVSEPFTIAGEKTTGDTNTVTFNRDGTDTIDGGTTAVILSNSGESRVFSADEDTAPDNWTTTSFGIRAGDFAVDVFTDGVDFTAGSSTTVTLSQAPSSENNVTITFDGVTQHHSQFSVSGVTVTFSSAIPSGVSEIEAKIGVAAEINVPADGSVTESKHDSTGAASGDILTADGAGGATYETPDPAGKVLQMVYDDTPAVTTLPQSGGQIPNDGTPPLITEGTEIFDVAITPISASSRLVVDVELHFVGLTNNPNFVVSVFDDSTLIGATVMDIRISPEGCILRLRCFVSSTGSTASRNITVRGGPDNASSDIGLDTDFAAQKSNVMIMEIAT